MNSDTNLLQLKGNMNSSTDTPQKVHYDDNENKAHFASKCKLNLTEEEKQRLYALATKDFKVGLKKTNSFRVKNNQIVHCQEEPTENNKWNNSHNLQIQDLRKNLSNVKSNCGIVYQRDIEDPKETAMNPIAKQREIIFSRRSARRLTVNSEGNCVSPSSAQSKTKTESKYSKHAPEQLIVSIQDDYTSNNLKENETSELMKVFAKRSLKAKDGYIDKVVNLTTTTSECYSSNDKCGHQLAALQSSLSSATKAQQNVHNSAMVNLDSDQKKQRFDLSKSLSCNINGAENNNLTGCTTNDTERCNAESMEFLHLTLTSVPAQIL